LQDNSTYRQSFITHNACVIIPTYNNAGTLGNVLRSVLEYTDRVIVINDGSTDNTAEILASFPQVALVSYAKNKGKGVALRKGFVFAIEKGYDYAITIDSDGQHFASDLPLFLDKLATEKEAIIIGSRNLHQENMPGKNTFANKFSNFWFYVETVKKAPDTQSGYRLYPLYLMKNITFFGTKYEFEVEVLVRCAWKGIKITWIPVNVYYPPAEERISHFRPFPDFSRISVLNTILVLIAFLYIKPRDLILRMSRIENVKEMLRQNLFNKNESALKKASSIGFGVFMGIVPLWGFQMAVALGLAVVFRLNKALTLIASNISIPPMIPLIVFLSYLLGRPWMGDKAVNVIFSRNITVHDMWLNITQYIYGSISLAIVAGVLAFGITLMTLQFSSKLRAKGAQPKI
jgi:glycosyltransferase involved in cell wall biosynthesis